ncbi:MAG: cytochrome C oxidase subunit IV family protein [Bacteroidota bacterium]|nr:MAG: cytochrome C oxidase subunit IV family protein [Bacteroidota bacterium]
MENNEKHHISSYTSHALVLIALLVLTFITVYISKFHFGVFSVGVALLVASVKATTVLTWFMHLKFESKFTKWMVGGVFILFALVVIITFIDYLLR